MIALYLKSVGLEGLKIVSSWSLRAKNSMNLEVIKTPSTFMEILVMNVAVLLDSWIPQLKTGQTPKDCLTGTWAGVCLF